MKASENEFLEWLEKEFPAHSEYDHMNRLAYESWVGGLRLAFEAGFSLALQKTNQRKV